MLLVLFGCSSSNAPSTGDSDAGGTSDGGGGPPAAGQVYAHSSDTLYELEPISRTFETIGVMENCNVVTDIAVNAQDQIFGVAAFEEGDSGVKHGLVSIDPVTAKCTLVVEGMFANALSFVPKGVLDPDKEILVTVQGARYVSIDPDDGTITEIKASLGYSSSGDVVSVKNGGTYWSVNNFDDGMDDLVQFDPTTGEVIKNWGTLGHDRVYGIGYWGGVVYGFSADGAMFQIRFEGDEIVTEIVEATEIEFYGAGSSTIAPVVID